MKKRIKKNNLGRIRDKRHQMIKSMTNSLVFYERITTTPAKAKVVRSFAEKLITSAKKGSLHDRREILKKISNEIATKKLMEVYGPKYKDRKGGYLRLTKTEPRHGDNSAQVILEFV